MHSSDIMHCFPAILTIRSVPRASAKPVPCPVPSTEKKKKKVRRDGPGSKAAFEWMIGCPSVSTEHTPI